MQAALTDNIKFQVIVNGNLVEGLLQTSIVSSNCFSADSYAVTFAMGPPPLGDIVFWSALSSAYVEINVFNTSDAASQSLISGMTDSIHLNPLMGTVAIEGRDLSSTLIDSYRQQDFVNQTASEVAATVALYHGLTPVITATSSSVGRYYGDGYTRLSLGQFSRLRSDWDLLVQLARENSFDLFVNGMTLYFQPSSSPYNMPFRLAFSDLKTVRFERTLAIGSNTVARVQSWNSQNMALYTSNTSGDNEAIAASSDLTSAAGQPFLFPASNFTSQQVADAAGRYAAELKRLEIILHVEMPWDLRLSPRSTILIDETGSSLDAVYRVDNIERHFSTKTGSIQNIRAVAA